MKLDRLVSGVFLIPVFASPRFVCRRSEKSHGRCGEEEALKVRCSRSSFIETYLLLGSDVSFQTRKGRLQADWLRSVQLWGPAVPDDSPEAGSTLRKPVALKARKVGGAFQPFEREKLARFFLGLIWEAAVSSNIHDGHGRKRSLPQNRSGAHEEISVAHKTSFSNCSSSNHQESSRVGGGGWCMGSVTEYTIAAAAATAAAQSSEGGVPP
ncbi:hypothetical protein HPP92_020040 [Vanilla planifolia]|nr:hypothetical protein HPP92_020040 [Vanilla planifolia]